MTTLWWTLTLVLMLVGLIGVFVPLLPGTSLILLGAVLHRFLVPQASVGWPTLIGLTVLMLVSQAVDLASGAVGAKRFGATKWGAYGGIIGAIVGLFFGLPGLLIGPLLGVFIGELLGGKQLLSATKSTWGTLLGTTAGMVLKFLIALGMVGWFLAAALL